MLTEASERVALGVTALVAALCALALVALALVALVVALARALCGW